MARDTIDAPLVRSDALAGVILLDIYDMNCGDTILLTADEYLKAYGV